ncbi:RDD family protein [Campylobacter fetus]|uniref:RDD family protein n=1 Tax=Campylobacter fetus TaxID=196 RepID=UPI000FCAC3B0|nr:RDD family protein [Campylobacter fetus]RUT51599.1 hypothetical protein BWK67_03530 [Campylobacter fetus]RUT52328.1 hypothetical protein BWK51_03530 [Campylobacter fetus]
MSENLLDKLDRENIEVASINKRLWAYCVDEILISLLFMLAYYNALAKASDDIEVLMLMISNMVFQIALLRVIYQTFFIWYYGATPGKMIFKIICIDTVMLSKPSLQASFLRAIVRVLSEWLFYLGFVWALSNQSRQTWHDKLAKTVVCNAY